jgi:hypothetical protein
MLCLGNSAHVARRLSHQLRKQGTKLKIGIAAKGTVANQAAAIDQDE